MSGNLNAAPGQRPVAGPINGAYGTRQTTRARAADVLAMTRMGWSKEDIADREGITPERVRQLLKLATSEVSTPDLGGLEAGAVPVPTPRPKPRMTERTLVHRAVLAMDSDIRLRASPPAEKLFWLKSVRAIHALGDGHGLGFGQRGDGFKSRAEFAAALGGSNAELEALMDRGLLVDLEEDGIDLPSNIGLKPRQKIGRLPQRPAEPASPVVPSRPNRKASIPGQRSMLLGIPGGAPDEIGEAPEPNFGPNFPAAGGKEFGGALNPPIGNLVSDEISRQIFTKDLVRDVAIGTTATTTQGFEILEGSSGSGADSRASRQDLENLECREILVARQNLENLDAVAAPQAQADEHTPASAWVSVAAELARIVGLPRAPTPSEAVVVKGWLDAGASAETLRGVVHSAMMRENCPSEPALSYFDGPVRDVLKGADRSRLSPSPLAAGKAAQPVAPALSTDMQCALDRLNTLWREYSNNRAGPFPPANSRFIAASAGPAGEAIATTWLDLMEAWNKRSRTGDRPPEFDAWMAGASRTWEANVDAVTDVSAEIICDVLLAPEPPLEASG